MLELLSIITPIAIFDSLSIIPVCIVPIIILLNSKRPVFFMFIFVLGIVIVYVPFGILTIYGLSSFIELASDIFSRWLHQDKDNLSYLVRLVIGLLILSLAYYVAKKRTDNLSHSPVIKITALNTFTFSSVMMLSGLWGALPYFAAIDQIVKSEVESREILAAILYYNFVFIAPLVILFIIGIALGDDAKPFLQKIVNLLLHFGKLVITATLIFLGALLVSDSIGWYLGYPFLPV